MRLPYIIFGLLIFGCSSRTNLKELSAQEIRETEKAFAKMANEVGIDKAFIEFADESAVLNRNNILISGIDAIKEHFNSPTPKGTTLQWSPDFVEVSSSGDLGYTYGKFTYTRLDSAGNTLQSTGIFHTVWKKQEDGTWKYVWD